MDSTRIKVKIGDHEFEAEGPTKVVEKQFDDFKKLIAGTPQQITGSVKLTAKKAGGGGAASALDRITKVAGRVVSLTVKPEAEATAAMLIMLAQKAYRENETVTASELKDGLKQSGYQPKRIDRMMQPLTENGDVIKIGARKGTRYRFTNQGLMRAEVAAREALGQVTQ